MEATPSTGPVSLEEYLAYHPDDRKYELQAGWIVGEPHPSFDHGWICTGIVVRLAEFARSRRLGSVVAGEGGYLLARNPPTVRVPDVSFVAEERAAAQRGSWSTFPGPPDLAVEVLSPSNTRAEMHAKVADYLAGGCPLVWVVDPQRRTVAVHQNLLFPITLGDSDVLDGGQVLPGFSVHVSELFEP